MPLTIFGDGTVEFGGKLLACEEPDRQIVDPERETGTGA